MAKANTDVSKHTKYWVRVRLKTKLDEKKGEDKNRQGNKIQTISRKSDGESGRGGE